MRIWVAVKWKIRCKADANQSRVLLFTRISGTGKEEGVVIRKSGYFPIFNVAFGLRREGGRCFAVERNKSVWDL